MSRSFFKGKSTHAKIFTAISAVGIAVIIALNLLFTYLSTVSTMFVDLTVEGMYSLSTRMEAACDSLLLDSSGDERDVSLKFTFCADPDTLIASDLMRPTYYMALELSGKYDNIEVETVNVTYNPTAVSAYKTTSRDEIVSTDLIVSYGSKYRVVDGNTLWTSLPSYMGEYRIASVMSSLLAVEKPRAYFVTDHGETYYDPIFPDSEGSMALGEFADLLYDCGMEIKTLRLGEVDKIPDDCVLLIINDPTMDILADADRFDEMGYHSESEIIDMYLYGGGSVMVMKDPSVTLPNLEAIASEWGIMFNNCIIRDSDNKIGVDDTKFSAEYDTDEESFGYAYYSSYSTLSSAPKMAFKNAGYLSCAFVGTESVAEPGVANTSRTYAPFIGTYESAKAYHASGALYADTGYKCLAATSVRRQLDEYDSTSAYSYLFCVNSAEFLSNEIIGSQSHSNRDIVSTLVQNLARTDRYADTAIGGFSLNASDTYGGKIQANLTMAAEENSVFNGNYATTKKNSALTTAAQTWLTVLVVLPAAAALVVGVTVYIKRKFR